MSQKSLLSYFKSPASVTTLKRKYEVDSHNEDYKSKRKQQPSSEAQVEEKIVNPSVIEDNANALAERNRWLAKIKLQSKRTPALSPNINVSWFKALEKEFQKEYFSEISHKLVKETSTVYPPMDKIYSWTHFCDIKDVKVVILGQDPYHGPGQAHGLAFSVPVGIAIPPSLLNIYKELEANISGFEIPKHGYLKGWAVQGVLLLNTCLTVRAHQALSHNDWKWQLLTDAVIKWINNNLRNVVFLLWGGHAKKKMAFIDKAKHGIFCAPHPSPLSAHRGFLGCGHFSKTNDYLADHGKPKIDWTHLPKE